MRTRVAAVVLAFAGLLVAVAVGFAANSIASRSFTPGADALPSAGSLAPRANPATSGTATSEPTTPAKPKPKPRPKPNPKPKPTTTTSTTPDDHGGSGKGSSGKGSGSGSSGSHGGKGGDD